MAWQGFLFPFWRTNWPMRKFNRRLTNTHVPRMSKDCEHLVWIILFGTSSLLKVRTQDSKMQKSQNALVVSLLAMSRATELKESKGNKELVTCTTDAIALAMQGSHDMNMRQQAMKNKLWTRITRPCAIAQQWICRLNFSLGIFPNANKESAPLASTRQLQPQEQIYYWWTSELWQSKSPL